MNLSILVTNHKGVYLGVYKTTLKALEENTKLFFSRQEDSFGFLPVDIRGERYHYLTQVEGAEGGEFILQMKDGQWGNAQVANPFNVLKAKLIKAMGNYVR